jgi:hypothetical protein
MWISFPIGRRTRIIIPWFIAIPLIPVAAGVWVLGLTFDAVGWAWRTFGPQKRRPPSSPTASVKITVR